MDPPTSMIGENIVSRGILDDRRTESKRKIFKGNVIQEKVQLCYNFEHSQGKNRTGEQLVDFAKTETKTVNGTLHSKVSEQLELSVAFDICPVISFLF